jgi:hypothetical protein
MTHDPINHPRHYRNASGVECIDVAEHLSFNLGNAFKYVYRRELKGNPIQDLGKARWYLARERVLWSRLGTLWRPREMYPPLMDLARAIAATEPGPVGEALILIAGAEWAQSRHVNATRADHLLAHAIDELEQRGAP